MVADNNFDFNYEVEASTEAFVLLLIENSYDRWKKQFELKNVMSKIKSGTIPKSKERDAGMKQMNIQYKVPLQKYTSRPKTMRDKGWSNEGLIRYNTLYDEVELDRESNGDAFNKHIVSHFKDMKQTIQAVMSYEAVTEEQPPEMRFTCFQGSKFARNKQINVMPPTATGPHIEPAAANNTMDAPDLENATPVELDL
jgi:hypothetical protein